MAQIDNFIAMMQQKQVERAVLINDKPAHLFVASGDTPGPIILGAKLQGIVQEVTPPHLRNQLSQDGNSTSLINRRTAALKLAWRAAEAPSRSRLRVIKWSPPD